MLSEISSKHKTCETGLPSFLKCEVQGRKCDLCGQWCVKKQAPPGVEWRADVCMERGAERNPERQTDGNKESAPSKPHK